MKKASWNGLFVLSLIFLFVLPMACCEEDVKPDEETPPPATIDLKVEAGLPNESTMYDSAYVVLTKGSRVEKKNLELASRGDHTLAMGTVANVEPGDWLAEVSFYNNLSADKNEVTRTKLPITITERTFELVLSLTSAIVADSATLVTTDIGWRKYYSYNLTLKALRAVVELPFDPLDPYFSFKAQDPGWEYIYTDRTFYKRSDDGRTSDLRGSAAFEKYTETFELTDTTAFRDLTSTVTDWNFADGLFIATDGIDDVDEVIIYQTWTPGDANGSRTASDAALTKEDIHMRRKANRK